MKHLQRITAGIISIIVIIISCFAFPSSSRAQTGSAGCTITVGQMDTSQFPKVTIYANITDASGKPVVGLTQDKLQLTEDGVPVTDIVDFAGIGEPRPVDVVYVFDTTGSMGGEISGVIATSIQFADDLQNNGRDYRLGLVTFADSVLGVYNSDNTLMSTAQEFKNVVSGLIADGGDGDPENDYGALKRATQMKFREDTQVIFILISDAPPHHYGDSADGGTSFNDPDLTKERILALLQAKAITVYAVTANEPEFVDLARETGGAFYDLESNPDFTSIIANIGKTIATQYRITYKSPRPNYDGTRRNVQVNTTDCSGGTGGSVVYVENHLLNIQSSPLIGILCLLPLLVAFALPSLGQFGRSLFRSQPIVSPPQRPSPPPPITVQPPLYSPPVEQPVQLVAPVAGPPPQPVSTIVNTAPCAFCGNLLNPGARFCPGCGNVVNVASNPQVEVQKVCSNCGRPLRPGVKFCANCGVQS